MDGCEWGHSQGPGESFQVLKRSSGGRRCLGEGRLGVPGQVREFRFVLSFPSFPRENWNSRNVWKTPGSPRHPSSRHPRPSEISLVFMAFTSSLHGIHRAQNPVEAIPRFQKKAWVIDHEQNRPAERCGCPRWILEARVPKSRLKSREQSTRGSPPYF